MHEYRPERMRLRREAMGIRPERLAADIDRSVATVRLWESGTVTPNALQLVRLAELLGCTPGDFFEPVAA